MGDTLSAMAAPLWVAERGKARVFLFGDNPGAPNGDWFTDDVRSAVRASDKVWCEVPDDQDIAGHPLVTELGLSPDPLSERLGPERNGRFEAVSGSVAVDPAAIQALRPWLAAHLLDDALRRTAGTQPSHGVDRAIASLARQCGIPLCWELTVEGVVRLFADLPADAELAYFDLVLDRVERGPAGLDHDFAAWVAGDLSVAEALERSGFDRSPDLYERVGASRNAAWIPRIDHMLDRPGTRFVLVGVLHLVGESSVLRLLARHGQAVRRL